MGFDGKGFGDAMLFLAIAAAAGITFTIISAVNTIAFLFTRDFSQLAWGFGFAVAMGSLAGFYVWRIR